ncbi:Aquaporin-1 [Lamellibrachia satsuma]|nr:Aquaporin-1 [Lamellibrachia satsuma]
METYKERLAEEHRTAAFWRDVFAEFIATFLLVSVQSALPLTWGSAAGIGGPVYTALGMGFVVCSLAWTFGDFSGGHMNPAVTFSMAISAKITVVRALMYVIAQCAGGAAGTGFVYFVTPAARRERLSATMVNPEIETWRGMLVETWITAILVLTIYGATNDRRKENLFMPTIPIGFATTLGILTGKMVRPCALVIEDGSSVCTRYRRWFVRVHSAQKMVLPCAFGTEDGSSVCTRHRKWFVRVHSVQKMVRPCALGTEDGSSVCTGTEDGSSVCTRHRRWFVRVHSAQKMVRPCCSVFVLSSARTDPECDLVGWGSGSGGWGHEPLCTLRVSQPPCAGRYDARFVVGRLRA